MKMSDIEVFIFIVGLVILITLSIVQIFNPGVVDSGHNYLIYWVR